MMEPTVKQALRIVFLWAPAAIFGCAVVTAVSALFFAHLGVIVGPMLTLFLAYSIAELLRTIARRRGMAVVSYVETAVRLNLPLDAYLLAAERSERGTLAERLWYVRSTIGQGVPVGMALTGVPEVPADAAAKVAAAERLGQLQPALARVVSEEQKRHELMARTVPFYKFYPLLVGGSVLLMVTGFMVFVVPKFREIFKDFKIELPRSTQALMDVMEFMVIQTPLAAVIMIGFVLLLLIGIGVMLERTFVPPGRGGGSFSLLDTAVWYMPVVGRMSRDRSMAEVCRFVADTSRAGVPLPQALEQAEGLYINTLAREQVARWRMAILAGQPVAQAAEAAGMPRLVRGFLDNAAAPRAGGGDNVANVFDFLARYYAGRFSRLLILLKAAYEPVALLLLGLLVGFVTYALFYPLVALIDSVMKLYPEVGL